MYIFGMQVRIWTSNYIVLGEIDTLKDERLTDYIRDRKDFIAVTQARVLDHIGKELFRTPFLNVASRHIEIIMPGE
jgi:hypothetical protein